MSQPSDSARDESCAPVLVALPAPRPCSPRTTAMPPAPLDDRGSSPDPLQLPSPVPPHFARPALPRAGTSSETARPCSTLPSESASPPSPPEAANDGDCALPPPAKRPRTSCSAPSAWRPLPPRPPSSGQSTPSDTVKIRVKARDEWSCWSCGDQADDLQVCHAVPKRAWTAVRGSKHPRHPRR